MRHCLAGGMIRACTCRQGEQGEVYISDDPQDAKIIAGFSLNHMNMRDAGSGKVRAAAAGGYRLKRGLHVYCIPASVSLALHFCTGAGSVSPRGETMSANDFGLPAHRDLTLPQLRPDRVGITAGLGFEIFLRGVGGPCAAQHFGVSGNLQRGQLLVGRENGRPPAAAVPLLSAARFVSACLLVSSCNQSIAYRLIHGESRRMTSSCFKRSIFKDTF